MKGNPAIVFCSRSPLPLLARKYPLRTYSVGVASVWAPQLLASNQYGVPLLSPQPMMRAACVPILAGGEDWRSWSKS